LPPPENLRKQTASNVDRAVKHRINSPSIAGSFSSGVITYVLACTLVRRDIYICVCSDVC
jgi:hypothetical protein